MSVERQLMMSSGGVQQYTISNSLRFRSSASAYLSRTPASASNRTTWTWSAWVKRGALGTDQYIFGVRNGISDTNALYLGFYSTNQFVVSSNNTPIPDIQTTQLFRDPSAWYHIVVAIDTTQATSTNRIKVYVNGTQITAFSTATYPAQNTNLGINQAYQHVIGAWYNGSSYLNYFDGYLTEINFIDGQALTPSSFGETSSTTGVWIPKKYTGSYGTNGFYLNFSNNTSTTALGYDTSGNSNNWTPNNFSLTTGATYDSMIDSPTSYASGTNNVGNYAVLNPLQNGNGALSGGNLNMTGPSSAWGSRLATIAVSSGAWYFEVTPTSGATTQGVMFGIIQNPAPADYLGAYSNGYSYYSADGKKYNSAAGQTYGATIADNDIVGIAFDANSGSITFYKNNVSQGVAFSSLTSGTWYLGISCFGTATAAINFGQRPFAYTPPSGYNALNTYNLSTPSIVDGSKQFAASLYTGTGSSLSVSGANFTPGMVWVKSRSAATDHALYDVIRGTQARLESNTTDAEVTSDNGVTAFNSTGFTVGTLAQVNTSSATYVGWQWKANGTAVTNTDGSITSSVSANQTAGFSVVTYTGNGVNTATVGHGLGVAPSMIFTKRRDTTSNWGVYTAVQGAQKFLLLNTTDAVQSSASAFYAVPTSTVISIGDASFSNVSTGTFVAYCFAAIPGYSAFGSYTGNGSTDGPFVYLGFRPRFILRKGTVTAGVNWSIIDTSRNTYNAANSNLYPNLSGAEGSSGDIDITSNGFKCRSSSFNDSGEVYIYAAFAENPFKYSLAR